MDLDDTIVAIASADGGAPRGVVRISGPQALEVTSRLLTRPRAVEEIDRPRAAEAELEINSGRRLPARLLLWPGRRSFTCQPTAEIHTIGSTPLLELVVERACGEGARLAQPGEFTLRAFLAGRIDLTQAEAVLGVIDATGEESLGRALKQLAGGLATPLAELREELLLLLADLEAGLDFADEDIEFIAAEVLVAQLDQVKQQVDHLVRQVEGRKLDDRRPRVVLVGEVNVGKSSLFNALVECFGDGTSRCKAIESPERGATRDYLTAEVRLSGVDCLLVDTAGQERVESETSPRSAAQLMTAAAQEDATLVLRCVDVSQAAEPTPSGKEGELLVLTKADTGSSLPSGNATSAHTGTGLRELAAAVAEQLSDRQCEIVPSTAQRSAASLVAAESAIKAARQLASSGGSEELVAMELRLSLNELGQVAGVVYTDDVLDRVFSRFCIGK